MCLLFSSKYEEVQNSGHFIFKIEVKSCWFYLKVKVKNLKMENKSIRD